MNELSDLEEYVLAYFIENRGSTLTLDDKYHRREEFEGTILGLINTEISPFNHIAGDYPNVASRFVEAMISGGGLSSIRDPRAGDYYKFDAGAYRLMVTKLRASSQIAKRARQVGPRYWPDVFATFTDDADSVALPASDYIPVPASDRIVTLGDNERAQIEPKLEAVLLEVEALNGEPEVRKFQDRIKGQLKAGRELIDAANFRAYVLYITLVTALIELVERYKDHVVGAAAFELLKAIGSHIYGVEL